jgi:hypothetical protein
MQDRRIGVKEVAGLALLPFPHDAGTQSTRWHLACRVNSMAAINVRVASMPRSASLRIPLAVTGERTAWSRSLRESEKSSTGPSRQAQLVGPSSHHPSLTSYSRCFLQNGISPQGFSFLLNFQDA